MRFHCDLGVTGALQRGCFPARPAQTDPAAAGYQVKSFSHQSDNLGLLPGLQAARCDPAAGMIYSMADNRLVSL